eukprot:scaffold69996_cov38-Phaeocystis_antarctica.AAC.1
MAADSLVTNCKPIAATTCCSARTRAAGSPRYCRTWSRIAAPRLWSTTRSQSGSRRRSSGRPEAAAQLLLVYANV